MLVKVKYLEQKKLDYVIKTFRSLFYGSAAISVIKKHIGLYTSLALHCTSTEEWLLSPVYTIQPVVKPVVKPV